MSSESIKRSRAVSVTAVLTLAGMTMAGCAMAGRPTLEQARAETEAAMQRIADEIPGGVVEVRTPDSAYLACDGGGYYSINRWAVAPQPGFDGEAFIDALPGRLGSDFVIAETVDIRSPAVAFDHASGAVFDVKVLGVEGDIVVDLLGLAPCGDGDPEGV
ncbi:hypothetical protein O1W71_12875 [Microbacterium sp. H37-C3]|uniref:hypothetical protein n=1 Tax=Microbacterium sp. H37-C3 TaxID=3004354 RepID=UPI0022B038F1|nr:hypothetical protein [Microbacterium sp. H37-C3]MCZ4068567.1 hypothetical protein [Microbacterium sp. H37-C3]